MSSTATASADFSRLFLASDAQMGKAWLLSTRIPLSKEALHHLALVSKIPSIAKARDAYGHFRTASQMNKVPGRYWKPEPDLTTSLEQASKLLNPQPVPTPMVRLSSLSADPIGGILLVTQQYAPDGTFTKPYITVVAAPALATLGPSDATNPPGFTFSDFWDDAVLEPFGIPADPALHCPFMAAAEGWSRKVKLPGITDLMEDSQPLFFPYGEMAASSVQVGTQLHYRAFFLPEVCGLPLGLVWPTQIGYADFLASVKSLKSDYTHFLTVLQTLQPSITSWLQAIALDPTPFILPSAPFLEVYDKGFPAVDTAGDYPDFIVDPQAFSPLQEMLHGYIWRLTCDAVLAVGTIHARKFLETFLDRGETALTADSYFGVKLPGRFCPNFAYHFKVANNWPTRPDPLTDLAKIHTVSLRAQDYDPVVIDLHIAQHPVLTLSTRDQLSTDAHRLQTPRFSAALPLQPGAGAPTAGAPPAQAPGAVSAAAPAPAPPAFGSSQPAASYPGGSYPNPYLLGTHHGDFLGQHQPPTIPLPPALYSPPAMTASGQQHTPASQPSRQLFAPFGSAANSSVTALAAVARHSDPTQATIITEQGRHEASPEFLHCCRLLVHNDVRVQLTDNVTGQILATHANLFPRQPTLHFRRDVLGPLFHKMSGYQPSVYNYVEALLSRNGIPVESTYAQSFFTAERLRAIYSVESWAMSPQIQNLASIPQQTFHVYSILQCLPHYQAHPTLLPAQGLDVLQAKSIAKMVHLLFAMIDMKPDFATSTFDTSVLGTRLSLWCQLPGLIPINSLWNTHPASATFYWFHSLRELLQIFHSWVKAQRFHITQGFNYARDSHGTVSLVLVDTLPSHIPGQSTHLMEALARYDMQFQQRWYTQAFTISDPLWAAVLPIDHFVRPSVPMPMPSSTVLPSASVPSHEPASKRVKLARSARPADFFCTGPLILPVEPLPGGKAAITTILHRLPRQGRFPMLPDANGTSSYICFKSCFPAPHDRCVTKTCIHHKTTPPAARLHIDLSVAHWKSKPEPYWTPLVEWLQLPGVKSHFRPSPELKALTPTTAWS
jgi:hypothetical protein